jgi:hypothetical protein
VYIFVYTNLIYVKLEYGIFFSLFHSLTLSLEAVDKRIFID